MKLYSYYTIVCTVKDVYYATTKLWCRYVPQFLMQPIIMVNYRFGRATYIIVMLKGLNWTRLKI